MNKINRDENLPDNIPNPFRCREIACGMLLASFLLLRLWRRRR